MDDENDQVPEGRSVDALALRGDEGRGTLRKGSGSCEQALIRTYPNGETHPQGYPSLNKIGLGGEPGELKHLSTRRKGHQRDSVSSGERTRTRPVLFCDEPEPSGKSGRSG